LAFLPGLSVIIRGSDSMWHPVRRALSFVLLLLFPLATVIEAREDNAELSTDAVQVSATRIGEDLAPPSIDGKVIDEAWLKVAPYSTFTQTDPIEGAPATERTEVRVLFDKTSVYIGIICFDSEPDKIIVNQNRRDADLTESDAVIVVFDTFNDNQNAFVFGTNPIGIEYDGQVSGEGAESHRTCRAPAARSAARSVRSTRTGMAIGA
jgi:Carbohydrate family 9 binding domain-like